MLHRMRGLGLPNVYLTSGVRVQMDQEGATFSYADLDGLYAAVGLAIAFRNADLTGPELRFLRKRLGMSQADLARIVGKSDQVIAKWEKGQLDVPRADGVAIRLRWLSEFAPQQLLTAVKLLTNGAPAAPRRPYVFVFKGRWKDDSANSMLPVVLHEAEIMTTEAIDKARAASRGYTEDASVVLPVRIISSTSQGTT